MPHTISILRDPADMARALGQLVSVFSVGEQPGYLDTLARMAARPSAAEELVVVEARAGGQRQGVILAQLLAGRAALVWPVQAAEFDLSRRLLQTAIEELRTRRIVVAQVLLAPDQSSQTQLFHAAGFVDGGELVYMAVDEEDFPAEPPTSEVEYLVVSPDDPNLARIISATYQGSLDCPLVDGWREISDVLAGYRSTGTHRPELWRLLHWRGEVAGCLLLSDFPEHEQGELTYLGVDPKYRGAGLGLDATRWTLHFAGRQNWRQVVLAVDAQNQPARRIYQEAGFSDLTRRRLLVRRLQ